MCTNVSHLDGGKKNISLKDGGGTKTFSICKMEYEIFFDYDELSFAMVLRIKNGHSLSCHDVAFSPPPSLECSKPTILH